MCFSPGRAHKEISPQLGHDPGRNGGQAQRNDEVGVVQKTGGQIYKAPRGAHALRHGFGPKRRNKRLRKIEKSHRQVPRPEEAASPKA